MAIKLFLTQDYYLFKVIDTSSDVDFLTQQLAMHDGYRNLNTYTHYHVGFHVSIKGTSLREIIEQWAQKDSRINVFYYIHLPPHLHISDKIETYKLNESKLIHVLPDEELNYGRFKDELWDLHLAGFQIYFHHVDRVKSFSKDLHYFQRLNNRGVLIGINTLWPVSWLSNDVHKIRKLITDLNVHFFNTEHIDIASELHQKEMLKKEQILADLI